jgi:hypothetical protein
MGAPILPIRSLVAALVAIRSLLGAYSAGLLVILTLWAMGVMSGGLAGEAQALGVVTTGGPSMMYSSDCFGCTVVSSAVASLWSDESDANDTGGLLAYATPENDAIGRTDNAISSDDARPLEAPKRVRLHHFLYPYEVMKPDNQPVVQARNKEAAPNRKPKPARRAPPPPPTTTQSTFAALPAVFRPVQPLLDSAPRSAAPVPSMILGKGQQVEIVSADELNSIDLAVAAPAPEQVTQRVASQRQLAQTASIMAGALAGVAVGLFLISWLEIGGNFQPRRTAG